MMDFCTSDNLLSILVTIVITASFRDEWILFFNEKLDRKLLG